MSRDKIRQLEQRFGLQSARIAEEFNGVALYAFRHKVQDRYVVTVCTVGSEQEYSCTVFEADLPAAVATLRTVFLRTDGPWVPGRVWLNDVPFLAGTRIQGIVVGEGVLAPVFALTEPEAVLVARESIAALTITLGRDPFALCDLDRENALTDISDEELAGIQVITAKLATSAPLRRLEYTTFGKFVALTEEEPAGYADDPDNFEFRSALELLPRVHGSRLFFRAPKPGETLRYSVQGWEYSVS
ncbi:hypothetical protein WG936_11450 [Corynebacterium sp. H127]|uniref:hypothetical protein n=1 Tax=Corynebacterium sp. H127 TaxID=3133418 RepID=UPI0030AC8975